MKRRGAQAACAVDHSDRRNVPLGAAHNAQPIIPDLRLSARCRTAPPRHPTYPAIGGSRAVTFGDILNRYPDVVKHLRTAAAQPQASALTRLLGCRVPSVPASSSDLSPAWLSEALGCEVARVEVIEQASATNHRLRLGLSYLVPGSGPASLFVKMPPLDVGHRQLIGANSMGEREVQFYTDVAPSSELRVPLAHFAVTADNGDYVLLLEDLTAAGCQFSDGSWGVEADAAAGALEGLATFHARFGDPAVRDRVAPWLAVPRQGWGEVVVELLRTVLDEHGDVLTPAYIAAGNFYADHWQHFDRWWDAGPQTYIHGDPHIGNVFLDEGKVGFHDWGLSRVGTPLRDVSYFLTMTVDPEERRRNERDLLLLYLETLRAAGGPKINFDDAWFAHRVQTGYTVLATFLVFMPGYAGPEAQMLGGDLRRRAELALEDLDVVDAMKVTLS